MDVMSELRMCEFINPRNCDYPIVFNKDVLMFKHSLVEYPGDSIIYKLAGMYDPMSIYYGISYTVNKMMKYLGPRETYLSYRIRMHYASDFGSCAVFSDFKEKFKLMDEFHDRKLDTSILDEFHEEICNPKEIKPLHGLIHDTWEHYEIECHDVHDYDLEENDSLHLDNSYLRYLYQL